VAYSLWDDASRLFWRLLGRSPERTIEAVGQASLPADAGGGQAFLPAADGAEPAEEVVAPAGSDGEEEAVGEVA
jgi:hypothetical protein